MAEMYEGWCIVELFGHKRMAGYLRSQEIPGGSLPCLDVPATETTPDERGWGSKAPTAAYSKMIGVAAIYGITPCTEEVARRAARVIERGNDPLPVSLPALTAGEVTVPVEVDAEGGGDDDDDDDLPFP